VKVVDSSQRPKNRLHLMWERVRTVPGLARDVTALVVVVALGIAAGSVILTQLDVSPPWASKRVVEAEFAQAVAVSPGNAQEVRIAGVEVGRITAARPTERGTSVITMELDPGHEIYRNAHAVLRPVNPLNQMYITLSPGGPPALPLGPDEVLPVTQTERPVQAEEVFEKLDDRSRVALAALMSESDNALANAPETLPAGLRSTGDTLDALQPVMQKLAQRRENIQRLVAAVGEASTALGGNDERLTKLVTSLQQTLGVLSARDDDLARSLQAMPGATDEIRNVLGSLGGLTDELNPTLDNLETASADLPDALSALADTTRPLREVIDRLGPVVANGRPVVAGLRPAVDDVQGALLDLAPVAHCLDDVTSKVTPWMYDLGGFVYNTKSLFSVHDQNGGWGRGHVTVDLNSPTGTRRPDEDRTNTYQQGGSPIGEYPAVGSGTCQ